MEIQENISLQPYNTFKIDVNARAFVEVHSRDELLELLQPGSILAPPLPRDRLLVLGGGSNVLFTGDYEGLIVKISLMGIETVREDKEHVWVKAGAGEEWDRFVGYCAGNGFGGLENLSGIPGSVGAAPIQNIGAYGAEVKETIDSVEVYDMKRGEVVVFKNEDCHFGYRDSIFKHKFKGSVVILSVTFRLRSIPTLNLTYKALREKLSGVLPGSLTLSKVRETVLSIRASKLPEPERLGSAGSFFKNPLVDKEKLMQLQEKYPDIAHFPASGNEYKIAAGWMIERCGWKGYRKGEAGVHDKQALVLVNHGNASGEQILDLAMMIKESVYKKFDISIEPEVQII